MGNLVYLSENMKTYYFFSSTLGSLVAIAWLFNSTHESVAVVGSIVIIATYIYSLYFLLFGHKSETTRLQRFKILKEGYEQGRFEENIERTYGYGKYEKEDVN